MSNNRNLLKEAIADAKAVKETAIANAKAALEEAFTPHLKSMLAAKLEEMDREDDIDEDEDAMFNELSTGLDEGSYGDDDEGLEEYGRGEKMKTEEMDDEEINLEELLAELEEGEDKDEVKEAKEDMQSEEVTEEEEGEMEDEEIDLEDMTEDDLKSFIEDVIKGMVENGELEAGEEMESEEEMDMGVDMEGDDDIDIEDEDESMEDEEELEEDDAVSKKLKDGASLDSAPRKVGQTTIQEKKFNESLADIENLKKELQEVNLLNAKLLYTNKIFKAKNLSEDKKVRVLKAFDKATSVKEAKVIFETLNEGLTSTTTTSSRINEVKGSASKAMGVSRQSVKQPIVENDAFLRMQKLAGIIKEN